MGMQMTINAANYETEARTESRVGDWMETYSGGKFYPLDPRPDEIDIKDIAHALSNICRFAGHVSKFYSVAQHSVLVSRIVPEELKLTALLHDASEAYLSDIPRPLKLSLPEYQKIEHSVMTAIAIKYGLVWPMPKEIKVADNTILAVEKRCLKPNSQFIWSVEELDDKSMLINPFFPNVAELVFMQEFEYLNAKKNSL